MRGPTMTEEQIWKYAMGCSISTYGPKVGKPIAEDLASEAYDVFCRRTEGTAKRNAVGYVKVSIPLILRERILSKKKISNKIESSMGEIAETFQDDISFSGVYAQRNREKAREKLVEICKMLSNKGPQGKLISSRIKLAMDNEIFNFSELARRLGVSRQAINSGLRYARKFLPDEL